MIAANELRIGNWVKFKHIWDGEVSEIFTHSVVLKGKVSSIFPLNVINPIPLTPEILDKAGFVKHGNEWHLQIGRIFFRFMLQDADFTLGVQPDIGLSGFIIPSECYADTYLHSLQNLIFALAGTELEIKL